MCRNSACSTLCQCTHCFKCFGFGKLVDWVYGTWDYKRCLKLRSKFLRNILSTNFGYKRYKSWFFNLLTKTFISNLLPTDPQFRILRLSFSVIQSNTEHKLELFKQFRNFTYYKYNEVETLNNWILSIGISNIQSGLKINYNQN